MEDVQSEMNPGPELYKYLTTLLPFHHEITEASNLDFVNQSDTILKECGDMAKVSHDSCLAYLLRRLITGAVWVKRRCDLLNHGQAEFIRMLRCHLAENYTIPSGHLEKVVVLLLECVKARDRDVAPGLKKRMRQDAVKNGQRCYVCGHPVTLDDGTPQMAEVEHVWPRALGGCSLPDNLRVACRDCNNKKRDFLYASDYHYEEMCAVVVDRSDPKFGTALTGEYRLAVLARSTFTCAVCGRSPLDVGPLRYARRDQRDAWHFMNTHAVCELHDSEA